MKKILSEDRLMENRTTIGKRIGILLLLFMIVISAFAVPASGEQTAVTRCSVRLRKSAGTNSSSLATLVGGTEVTVLSDSGAWWQVRYGSMTGYISSEYLMQLTRSGYYPLHQGDDNPYVITLQKKLIELGYLKGSADGSYGSATVAAVRAFQSNNGLKADGIAGGETQKLLYSGKASGASGSGSATGDSAGNNAGSSAAAGNYTTLKTGMKGDEVKALQQRLIELGYLAASATGYYGAATAAAVRAFQRAHGLTADGKAGSITQSVLFSSAAKAAGGSGSGSSTDATLRQGMSSADVKSLQQKLIELGYLKSSATGYFGSATLTAVKKFQEANGLTADGVAGPATMNKLYANPVSASGTTSSQANTSAYSTLKRGQTSEDIKRMQQMLKQLGYLSAGATGYFGSATYAAVKEFQAANNLSVDGVAGPGTLTVLYSGNAVKASSASSASSASGSGGSSSSSGPSAANVKLLHWQNYVKGTMSYGDVITVYDPATRYSWSLKVYSRGRHLDAEPLTAQDTANMNAAFGGVTTWTPKVVYVKLKTGEWTMATTHNTPHMSGSIDNNNFNGHLCVHFLRDMSECEANDPNYGVTHQNALRQGWLSLTGEIVE